jgi:hypothetical protein
MPFLRVAGSLQFLIAGRSTSFGVLQPADVDGLARFREIPTFGNGTIRKFSNNTSEMKRLAARDFEDILQVFPSHITLHLIR